MKISVLMAVYNAQDTVLRAIDSILNQTIKDFELVFWDIVIMLIDKVQMNLGHICIHLKQRY